MSNEEEQHTLFARLEAVLFLHGEELSFQKISHMLHIALEAVPALVAEFGKQYASKERGILLLVRDAKVQLVTKPEQSELVSQFLKEELTEELTPASLETLSIITYLGPVPRSRIEYLRGVNSLFTLRSLRLRGLIERIPDPKNSNAFLYQASLDLLKHLGTVKENQLPDYEKFHALLERFRMEGGEDAKEYTKDTSRA